MVNMVECLKCENSSPTRRCLVCTSILAVMLLLFTLIFSAGLFSSSSSGTPRPEAWRRDVNLDLKLVHVLFRHGSRTPADTYPTDPYINETFAPFGWGQLTNVGKNEMFSLGEFLRSTYNGFLGSQMKLDDIHAQCTGVGRTKMSLQLVLAGLFKPKDTGLEWNKNLNWQPVPYDYQPLDQDTLLLVRTPCPRYHEELQRVFDEDIKSYLNENSLLMEELSNITGWTIKTPDDVQSLYSTLKAEKEFGLKLPKWTEEFYPEKLQKLTDQSFVFNAYNSELKKLKGGVFVKKALDDWKKKSNSNLKPKIFVYAGHDATVTNILSAFNVWEQQFPNYGITAILELSQHKISKEYGVEIFLRNSTKTAPRQLTIPGCEKFCSITKLEELLKENIPNDFKLECASKNPNFTTPPPAGP